MLAAEPNGIAAPQTGEQEHVDPDAFLGAQLPSRAIALRDLVLVWRS